MEEVTGEQKIRMVEFYASGESTAQTGQRLQVSNLTVNPWLHQLGVVLRGQA